MDFLRPRVSVLMPVYNGARWLHETLQCLSQQSLSQFEVVAVNDGSHDQTAAILDRAAQRDARIRPLHLAHQGIVGALNQGLLECRGTYIARMDADDLCDPVRLERQVAYLDKNPQVGLVASLVRYGGDVEQFGGFAAYVDWVNQQVSPVDIAQNRFVESPLIHPSVCFRAEIPKVYGAYRDGSFPEDYECWLRWLDAGVVMAKVPETLVTWREREGRLSREDERYAVDAFYAIKTAYLKAHLKRVLRGRRLLIWGAGRPTRLRAELLVEHGLMIDGYIDVDPQKVGNCIKGRPVLDMNAIPKPEDAYVLSYVRNRGARDEIEAFLQKRSFEPVQDFMLAG